MKDAKILAREILIELDSISNPKVCEWINEKQALMEFPFSLDMLRDMRGDGRLEYRHHWKYIKEPGESRKRPGIIYHRSRMIQYVDSL